MMVLADLAIHMEVFPVAVMAPLLIGLLEVLVLGLVIMVGMVVEMTSVVVLGVMAAVVVLEPVAMQAIEENHRLATLVAMVPIWGALVADMVGVG